MFPGDVLSPKLRLATYLQTRSLDKAQRQYILARSDHACRRLYQMSAERTI